MKSVEIENALINIDPVRFERLIGDMVPYICKLKTNSNTHIEKIGVQHGKLRTTKGTPDIFIVSDAKNIAVQCSVDSKIETKIKHDIDRCIEEFEKQQIALHEIIFCCNQNIKIKTLNEILEYVTGKGFNFIFVGLDDLTQLIYLQCPIIANDWLNINLSDGSLNSLLSYKATKQFTEEHNCKFHYREEDKNKLLDFISNGSVIVYGKAGDGKTRFVLEVAEEWQNQGAKREVYVLNNSSFDISKDFNRFLVNTDVEYLLIIDDINRVSIFDRINKFVHEKNNIKIVATVRDYALKSIMSVYRTDFDTYELKSLTNDEIKNIIKQEYNIQNDKYLDYIIKVSKGNLRFAILASRTILKTDNSYPEIKDILENHFIKIFKDINEESLIRDEKLLKTLGIFAFFQKIYLKDKNESLLNNILDTFKLAKEDFLYSIQYWDNKEIIKLIYDDNIAVMEDQILRTYLFNYVFIHKKILKLEDLLVKFLKTHRGNIVDSINSLNYVYNNNLYLVSEIKRVQDILYEEDNPLLFTYLSALELANPSESLEIIDKKLKTNKKEYVELLINFLETDYSEQATNLIFRELKNSTGEYKETIEKLIIENYIVTQKSFDNNYDTQNQMLKLLKSLDGQVCFKIKVIEKHCKFCFESTESYGRNLTFYNVPLGWNLGVEVYRKLLWDIVNDVYKQCSCNELGQLSKAITHYSILKTAKKTESLEFSLIQNFLNTISEKEFSSLVFKYSLLRYFERINKKMFSTKHIKEKALALKLLDMQERSSYRWPEKYDNITKELKNLTKRKIFKIIRQLKQSSDVIESYKTPTETIINLLLEQKTYKDCARLDIIKFLNSEFSSCYIYSDKFIELLIEENGFNKIKLLFEKSCFEYKWNYLFSVFCYADKIDETIYNECLNLFSNTSNLKVVRGCDQILRLNKYYDFNYDFYIESTNLALNEDNYMVCLVFSTLFHKEIVQKSIVYYKESIDVLIQLYFRLLSKKHHVDYERNFINYIIDLDKEYLKEYIKNVDQIDVRFLWKRQDWKDLIIFLCKYLLNNKILSRFDMEHVLACGDTNQQIEILEELILFNIDDREKLFKLMSIVEEYSHDIQKKFIILLMTNKCKKELLLKIPIAGGPHSWSGSRVHYIEKNYDMLLDVKNKLKEKKLLEYELIINQYIQWNRKELTRTQIEEYNEGYL